MHAGDWELRCLGIALTVLRLSMVVQKYKSLSADYGDFNELVQPWQSALLQQIHHVDDAAWQIRSLRQTNLRSLSLDDVLRTTILLNH